MVSYGYPSHYAGVTVNRKFNHGAQCTDSHKAQVILQEWDATALCAAVDTFNYTSAAMSLLGTVIKGSRKCLECLL